MAVTTTPLEAVQDLGPLIAAHADSIERERRLPPEVVRALVDAGVFRLLVPRAFGGAQVDPLTACRVVEEVSRADGAAGWCAMIGMCYGQFAGLLPEQAAREIYSDPATIVAGAFRPNGVARAVPGGYRVTGRWPLGSGITHSTWTLGGCRIFDGDQPRCAANGAPEFRLLFWPSSETEILDTWHVAGLRGTGSHDYTVTELFVPQHRACWFSQAPVQPGPLYSLPAIALFAAFIGSVPLGIGRHALDAFRDLAAVKKPVRSETLIRERPVTQAQVGEAEGLLRAGRAFLFETATAAWDVATSGQTLTWEQRGLMWLAATQAAVQASQAVDLMFRAGGASSIYATSPLERCLRDVHTAGQHICAVTTNYEVAGQMFLGLDLSKSQWALDNRGDV
jgi:alkylation response protein AidB-like acyl-CoA dehydrogenase